MNKYLEEIQEINEDAIVLDGLDDCIVGIVQKFEGFVLLYSIRKIIDTLVEQDGMTEDEAWEFYNFNIVGGYLGEFTPVFLEEIE